MGLVVLGLPILLLPVAHLCLLGHCSYLAREAKTPADRGITMLTGWGPDLGQGF